MKHIDNIERAKDFIIEDLQEALVLRGEKFYRKKELLDKTFNELLYLIINNSVPINFKKSDPTFKSAENS